MELQTMPLKFRVWDNEEKELIYNAELAYDYLYPDHNPLCVHNFYELIEDDRYTISQDTGLKDKNGKSIFIGDIVKYNSPIYENIIISAVIAYRNGTIVYDYGDKFDIESQRYEQVQLTMYDEVVGNIWQNSELLEEK